MFQLAKKLGKQTAHHILHDITVDPDFVAKPFRQRILETKEIMDVMTAAELEAVFDYSKYLGESANEVTNTITYCAEKSQNDQQYIDM